MSAILEAAAGLLAPTDVLTGIVKYRGCGHYALVAQELVHYPAYGYQAGLRADQRQFFSQQRIPQAITFLAPMIGLFSFIAPLDTSVR